MLELQSMGDKVQEMKRRERSCYLSFLPPNIGLTGGETTRVGLWITFKSLSRDHSGE